MGKWIHRLYPFLIGLIVSGVFYWQGISYKIHNFEKVLDNTTIFSSIVVGFLGALLGILVSIKDSEIVKGIFETRERDTLKLYFNETFLLGLSVVIFSSVMQVMRSSDSIAALALFHIWLVLSVWFIPSTHRIISILMNVFFKSNSQNAKIRPIEVKEITTEKNNEIKSRLSKP